jgi:hypothetical protein
MSHFLAAVASLINGLFWYYQGMIFLAVLISLYRYLRDYWEFQAYQLRYSAAADWQLAGQNSEFQTLQILPSSVITAWVTVLHFQIADKKQQLVIFKDALADKDYRALVVMLKTG